MNRQRLAELGTGLRRQGEVCRQSARRFAAAGDHTEAGYSLQRAEELERLANAAESGNWPPDGAWLCVRCAEDADPEGGRCAVCDRVSCCGPAPRWAERCVVCHESMCPHCRRWIPNCQRGV
jgi:hypothetical protein